MNQLHPDWTEYDEAAAQAVRLPGARVLLDSAELSAVLGEHASISRVRIKPGHSVVAAFTTAEAQPGWAILTTDADKLAKARHRAEDCSGDHAEDARGEIPFRVHTENRPFLVSGSLWTDPVLAKDLREARRALDQGAGQPWRILRHNPRRRVVAAVPSASDDGGEKILRVAARGTTSTSLRTAQRWLDLGLPLVRSTAVGSRGTALSAPLWGWTDLSGHPHGPAAVTAGETLGTLHQVTTGSDGAPLPEGSMSAAAAIAMIAPWLGSRAHALAQRIERASSTFGTVANTELHGDLSPDQVVLAAPGSHKIRLIDFDRATTGDPMRDLGSWAAACRRLELGGLLEDFLAGYRTRRDPDLARATLWEAHAQLLAAPDAFRTRAPRWPELMHHTLTLGEEALDR